MHWTFSDSLPVFVFLRFAVIASGCASCPRLVCHREGCGAEFCYHCKQAWHPNQTCDSARQQRAQSLHTHSNHSPSYTQEQGPSEFLEALHCATSLQSSCQPRVNLMYPGLNDINQCSVALVTTVIAKFAFSDLLKCVGRSRKSPPFSWHFCLPSNILSPSVFVKSTFSFRQHAHSAASFGLSTPCSFCSRLNPPEVIWVRVSV